MDGYEVAREIRNRHTGTGVPLVALTGWGQEEDRRRAMEAGFDAHLVKPAEIDALRRVLDAVSKETLQWRSRPSRSAAFRDHPSS